MSRYIHIPQPCGEDWNHMTPAGNGRHCALCTKTVVDFTEWPLENIAAYLKKHSSEPICGRFRNSQLHVEIPYSREEWVAQVAGSGFSFLQKLALICLLAFGFLTSGCGTGDRPAVQTAQTSAPLAVDSAAGCMPPVDTAEPMLLGEIAPPPAKTTTGRISRTSGRKAGQKQNADQQVTGLPNPGPYETTGPPALEVAPVLPRHTTAADTGAR